VVLAEDNKIYCFVLPGLDLPTCYFFENAWGGWKLDIALSR
jgi:hypothetical protein